MMKNGNNDGIKISAQIKREFWMEERICVDSMIDIIIIAIVINTLIRKRIFASLP